MTEFAVYWIGIAAVCRDGVRDRLGRAGRSSKSRVALSTVLAQFLPSLFVGAAVTVVLLNVDAGAAARLPGWWALLFGLGVFASRPYLHRSVGWVGASYLVGGSALLIVAEPGVVPSPWTMGLTFGAGQMLLAAVLYRAVEREAR